MVEDPFTKRSAKLLEAFDFAAEAAANAEEQQEQSVRLFRSLLEVMDSFDRLLAATNVPSGADPAETTAGPNTVRLIAKQLERALQQAGVTPIACLGEVVDPERHEITEVRETDASQDDVIIEVLNRGYEWEGRLLRRPQVIVARGPKEAKG